MNELPLWRIKVLRGIGLLAAQREGEIVIREAEMDQGCAERPDAAQVKTEGDSE